MLRLEGMLCYHISMMIYDILGMLSQGPLHGHLARYSLFLFVFSTPLVLFYELC
jgi:hypothetical protein